MAWRCVVIAPLWIRFLPPFDIYRAKPHAESAIVLSLPHSGRHYPDDLKAASRLDFLGLRTSEDAYLDQLYDIETGDFAAIMANAARAYVDVNRDPRELDAQLIDGPLPKHSLYQTPKVKAGFGVVARCVKADVPIYHHRLSLKEVQARLEAFHAPYHAALKTLLVRQKAEFGTGLLLDLHSMPHTVALTRNGKSVDVVLGTLDGAACNRDIVLMVKSAFEAEGFRVALDDPFAGGHILSCHTNPKKGIMGVQIELNRALYMDEDTLTPHQGFEPLKAKLRRVLAAIRTKQKKTDTTFK